LQTIGFPDIAIGFVVIAEGILLGLAGSTIGIGSATLFLSWRGLTFGSEGQLLALTPDTTVLWSGLLLALLLGLFASLAPAWIAMRRPIVESLRS
jgi:ABC-type antimicrobial peptide transport system permease subunit